MGSGGTVTALDVFYDGCERHVMGGVVLGLPPRATLLVM